MRLGDLDIASIIATLGSERVELAAAFVELQQDQPNLIDSILHTGRGAEIGTTRAMNLCLPEMDLKTGQLTQVVATIAQAGKDAVLIHPSEVDRWHLPETERDYERSPHRAYWRTAKELKMDAYEAVPSIMDAGRW